MFDLSGRVALIAGGTRGIGRAVADRYCAMGGRVVVASRSLGASQAAAAELEARFGADRAFGLSFDLGDSSTLAPLVERSAGKWGRLDTLVANGFSGVAGPTLSTSDDVFTDTLKVNVVHNARLAQLSLPHLVEADGGSAVFVGSASGVAPSPGVGAYGIAKRALHHLVQNLAVEWGPLNVRVNAVAPGMTRTSIVMETVPEAVQAKCAAPWPIARLGEPDEIAAACVFLATPEAGFITGHILVADGGRTLVNGNTLSLNFADT